ncbi:MAG: trypsin-like peptidase domain-containing protein [Cyanobacteria bacterium P01_A01_bin.17]
MNQSYWWGGGLGAAVVLVWVCPTASALTSSAISQIAKSSTVRIVSQTAGSGVLIQQNGETYTVLTAAHVVESADTYDVITPDGKRAQPVTIKKLPDVDLALVQFKSPQSYSVVELGDSGQASEGSLSYVAGFPLRTEAISETIYNFTEGKITANAGQSLKDGYSLIYSNNTLPGMSGGPVLNAQGKLIGIHGRADTTEKVQNQSLNPEIYIKSGFNLGIPTRTFLRLASQAGLNLGFVVPAAQTPNQTKADDFFLQAQRQMKQRDYQGAIATLNQAINLNPNYSAAYALRGDAQARLGQGVLAAADSAQAIRLDPKNALAYLVRGLVRSRLGETQQALADVNQSIRLRPSEPAGYITRGFVRMLLEDYAGNVADMRKAGQLWRAQGNSAQADSIEGAIPNFNRLAEGQGTSEHYIARAAMRLDFADQAGAVSDFQTAASVARQRRQLPPYLTAKYMLRATEPSAAQRYATQENPQAVFTDAQGVLNRLNQKIQHSPSDAGLYRLRGTLLAEILHQQPQAIPDIQRAASFYRAQQDMTNYQLMTSYLAVLKGQSRR